MTKVEIALSEDVKEMAEKQGLLQPGIIEGLIREEMIRRRSLTELVEMARKISSQDEPKSESEVQEYVQAEIDAYRAERRKVNARRS